MPALKNVRHEAYCQLTIEGKKYGWSQAEIYQRAGYTCDKASAAMASSRLIQKDEIRARIAELACPPAASKRARVTVSTVTEQLDRVYEGAVQDAQYSAAGSAIIAKAKLHGLDRADPNATGGEFAGCRTKAELLDAFLAGYASPGAAIDHLRAMISEIEQHAAGRARLIGP